MVGKRKSPSTKGESHRFSQRSAKKGKANHPFLPSTSSSSGVSFPNQKSSSYLAELYGNTSSEQEGSDKAKPIILDVLLRFASNPTLDDTLCLSTYLQVGSDLQSKEMVAKTLFPWVIENSMTSGTKPSTRLKGDLLGRTLLLCLDILSEDQTRPILSTQAINKLIASILGSAPNDDIVILYVKILSHYRPTMDVACKVVLSNVKPKSILLQPTIHWLLSLHQSGRGNPKTTFQLVPELNLLLLLNDSDVSKQFLSGVLFDPQHHIDGFLALLQAQSDSTFKTYHTSLFRYIDEGLNDESKRSKMSSMLPLLLECFFEQSKVFFETNERRKGLPLATIQFRMFRKWSNHILTDMKESTLFLSQMLRSVEKHNAYLPNEECTSFLTEFVIPLVEVSDDESTWSMTSDCFCSLLKLNHSLLGGHVDAVVRISIQSNQFMAAFVDTFKRLRQQHKIYSVLIAVASQESVVNRLRDKDFSKRLTASFESATLLEMTETFLALELWYKERFDGSNENERKAVDIIAAMVIPSIRVDQGNAKDIAKSCQELVLQAKTVQLGALCLNLHLKCLFWLGRHSKLQLPTNIILSRIDAVDGEPEKEATATVWCHQLRENALLVQEKEINYLQESGSDAESQLLDLKNQCEIVAHRVSATRCWKVVLENFHSWIPYAVKDDIEMLCRWMWCRVGQYTDIDSIHDGIQDLLKTSYFYEHEVIANNLRLFAFTEVFETILKLVDEPEKIRGESSCQGSSQTISLSPGLRTRLIAAATSSRGLRRLEHCANRCTRILDLALRLPRTTKSPSIKSKHTEFLLLIDQACTAVTGAVSSAVSFLSTIANCRILLSMEFGDCSSENPLQLLCLEGFDIVYPILKSTIDLVQSKPDAEYAAIDEVIKSTGKLFYSLPSLSLDRSLATGRYLVELNSLFVSLKAEMKHSSPLFQRAMLGLASFFVSATKSCFIRETKDNEIIDQTQQLFINLKGLAVEYEALHSKRDRAAECDLLNSLLNDLAAATQWSIAGSDFSSGVLNQLQSNVTKDTILAIYPMVTRQGSNTAKILNAVVKASNTISVHENEQLCASLDSLFCHLINVAGQRELQASLKVLLRNTDNQASMLRFLCYCITQSTQEVQADVLQNYGRDIFSVGMRGTSVLSLQRKDYRIVKSALMLLKELLTRRDVFVFRESDLAGLLSRLSDVLNETKGAEDQLSLAVQNTASLIYLTAIQRYANVIYACAPLVIYMLRELMTSIFDGPSFAQEDRGRMFIQICSLLSSSKDVYKKYVVGVVLEFTRRLDGRSFNFVLPAIYALLDMMSSHETEQLNALMNVKRRSMFKPIYDGYQKHHVFKG